MATSGSSLARAELSGLDMTLRTLSGAVLLVGVLGYYCLTRAWDRWDWFSHAIIVLSGVAGYVAHLLTASEKPRSPPGPL